MHVRKAFIQDVPLTPRNKRNPRKGTFCSAGTLHPSPPPPQNETWLRPRLHIYTYIYSIRTACWLNINRNVWNHCTGPRLPSTSSVCLYFLREAPLFTDNWRTQIIIPLQWKIGSYYLKSFAMPLCTLTQPSDCLFIIAAFLPKPTGIRPIPRKVPSLLFFRAFSCPWHHCVFLPELWFVSCLRPGWHTSNTRGARSCLTWSMMFSGSWMLSRHLHHPSWPVRPFFTEMKHWPVLAFGIFSWSV